MSDDVLQNHTMLTDNILCYTTETQSQKEFMTTVVIKRDTHNQKRTTASKYIGPENRVH